MAVIVLFTVIWLFIGFVKPMRPDAEWRRVFVAKEKIAEVHGYLNTHHSTFYSLLNSGQRSKFILRTLYLVRTKEFVERDTSFTTDEHKTKIAATIVQLTFGLQMPIASLPSFPFVIIYPTAFYSRLVGAQVKGLTVGNGQVFLSWRDFHLGHANPTDKLNLGLHEFAHALEIELRKERHHYYELG